TTNYFQQSSDSLSSTSSQLTTQSGRTQTETSYASDSTGQISSQIFTTDAILLTTATQQPTQPMQTCKDIRIFF
ncbi:unnamed protein product, partial [Rotaria socialis]